MKRLLMLFSMVVVFALGGVLALFHDVLVTVGALMLTGREISLTVIAALQRLKVKPGMVRTRVGSRKRIGFSAVGYYSDRARIEITDKVEFGTGDGAIATISNENNRHGLVVPVGAGSTSAFATEPITSIVSPPRRIVVKGGGGKNRTR